MAYVDGFVLPLPKDKVDTYKAMAEKAGTVWKKHGALEYRECILEDASAQELVPFPQLAKTQEGETVVFAYIVFESREHRDEVNKKVMEDQELKAMCDAGDAPFDYKRMAYGGFDVLVDLS